MEVTPPPYPLDKAIDVRYTWGLWNIGEDPETPIKTNPSGSPSATLSSLDRRGFGRVSCPVGVDNRPAAIHH